MLGVLWFKSVENIYHITNLEATKIRNILGNIFDFRSSFIDLGQIIRSIMINRAIGGSGDQGRQDLCATGTTF